MSDYRCGRLVSGTKIGNTDDMVARIRNGGRGVFVKPVDYDELRSAIKERYENAESSMLKVKHLEEQGHRQKQISIAQRHRRCSADSEHMVVKNLADEDLSMIFAELDYCNSLLDTALKVCENGSVEKLQKVRENIREWIEIQSLPKSVHADPHVLLSALNSVKQEHTLALRSLNTIQKDLESQLNINGLMDHTVVTDRQIDTGIPQEAFNMECPNLEWKASVLEEFILLDGRYVERLRDLEQRYEYLLKSFLLLTSRSLPGCLLIKRKRALKIKQVQKNRKLTNDSYGGWTSDDHSLFLYAYDQYMTQNISNRRHLFIDIILKLLPDKTRADILEHEEWVSQVRYYSAHRRDLISNWIRDRGELTNRIAAIFQERCAEVERMNVAAENRQKQKLICDQLYKKVVEYRKKKMEAMRLEQEIRERERQREAEREAQEISAGQSRRDNQKLRIQQYHSDLENKRNEEDKRNRARLVEIQRELERQAVKDRERVEYRRKVDAGRKKELKQKKKDEQTAAAEKERILEQIRDKVRPQVEGDLMRLWSDTLSWKHHYTTSHDDININKPLYDINSFTSNQIESDPRVRLEQMLREAGLHNTQYAREAMTTVKPLRAPRKDTTSTYVFNAGQES